MRLCPQQKPRFMLASFYKKAACNIQNPSKKEVDNQKVDKGFERHRLLPDGKLGSVVLGESIDDTFMRD